VGKCLLVVATDRISAFDVIMPNPIPGKGKILSGMSVFWFNMMTDIVENHLLSTDPFDFPVECGPYRKELVGRAMLVKKAKPFPVECVVRGYLSGSGWKDYLENRIKRIRKTIGTPVYAFHQGPGRKARHADNKKRDGKYRRLQTDEEDH
jgi:phosphoribosylaminoimidazole-succinocarboxamide synthase